MESEGCLTDLLTKDPSRAGHAHEGDSILLHCGAKQGTLLTADAWKVVGTKGVN